MIKDIVIVGTGGQGIVLASRMLAAAAFLSDLDVKESEIHGMAQRGGSVIGHIRFGEKVYSPTIPVGMADLILALEEMEALRYVHFLKKEGVILLNKKRILPAGLKKEDYPEDVEEKLKARGVRLFSLNGEELARELGNLRVENTLFLGVLSAWLPFHENTWEEVIKKSVPSKSLEVNLKAFYKGRELGEGWKLLEQRS